MSNIQVDAQDADVFQGRIFWLPEEHQLPRGAVRRAHGKGVVEEGIYGRPVVVVSRPAEDSHVVHFQLISSLQGKTLGQLYNKLSSAYDVSRRTWFLPIAPSPDHPDAISNRTRKRFPTLELSCDARLRWDSYVNIRHVYKIDWSLLKVYTNPESPNTQSFCFNKESRRCLIGRSKTLTRYEPGPQYGEHIADDVKRAASESDSQHPKNGLQRRLSEPIIVSTHIVQEVHTRNLSVPNIASTTSCVYSRTPSSFQSDFRDDCTSGSSWEVSPDSEAQLSACDLAPRTAWQPIDRMFKRVSAGFGAEMRPMSNVIRRPVDQFWVDAKGVMAVAIASI
ncbi:hypothetical protein P3342_009177 [Pyrenophora teres f. teres]|uniref:Uncharacterized protein n=2 Tax=Pyrenophora teres f. teres TaxID=97479 RepID=E3S6B4_PYRTT|nr:hypothetical protein PTT_18256 [Pyrenophora teres f. teres 0-1]KAK1908330.1 hypothetical protein P3342_009177 [Pyrenophora teres f. teres]CAE7192365.1 hypothetical protein PTTW11_07537 [Pyrenophora teres f. teres]